MAFKMVKNNLTSTFDQIGQAFWYVLLELVDASINLF